MIFLKQNNRKIEKKKGDLNQGLIIISSLGYSEPE